MRAAAVTSRLAAVSLFGLWLVGCNVAVTTPTASAPLTETPLRPVALAVATPLPTQARSSNDGGAEAAGLTQSAAEETTAPSPTAPAEVEGVGEILYADPFDENHGWDVGPSEFGVISISGGMLHISVTAPNSYLRTQWAQPPVKNVYVEVTARPSLCQARDEYALLFNLVDPDNHYRFSLTCDGLVQVVKVAGGRAQVLKDWMPTDAYLPGAPSESRIGAWSYEGRLRFLVNGAPIVALSDSSFIGGRVGAFVRSGPSGNTSVSFDDLVIRAVNP